MGTGAEDMSTTQQPEALAFCWATELAMTQQPVTLSVTEAREVSAEMQRLHTENTALQQGYAAARLEIESLRARGVASAGEYPALPKPGHRGPEGTGSYFDSFTADQMRAYVDADRAMRAAQHAGVMLGEQAELRRLSDCCPELNLSNYGPDDVDELNGWAIEVSQCIDRALAAQPAGAQQPAPSAAPATTEGHGRTDAEIVAQTVELTEYLLSWKWGLEPEGDTSRIWESENTKALVCWNAACHIQDLLTQTDVWNAVAELDGQLTPTPQAARKQGANHD